MVMLIVHVATIERAKWDNQPQNCIYIYKNPLWQGILAATGHIWHMTFREKPFCWYLPLSYIYIYSYNCITWLLQTPKNVNFWVPSGSISAKLINCNVHGQRHIGSLRQWKAVLFHQIGFNQAMSTTIYSTRWKSKASSLEKNTKNNQQKINRCTAFQAKHQAIQHPLAMAQGS